MPYQTIERLLSRRGEKVALMLTVENVAGIAALGGPVFMLAEGQPILLRAAAVLAAAVLGVLVTVETRGMIFYERVVWRARGQVRLLLKGRTVAPDDLPGTSAIARGHRAVARDGIVRKARPIRRRETVS